MSGKIARIIDGVIEREGGFVDHPHDRGGPTCFGITERTARANGYAGPMSELSRDVAHMIYGRQYVHEPGFGQVYAMTPAIGEELVDTGVLMGPGTAAKMLQRSLNVFNRDGADYADVVVDGGCGPVTRAALAAFVQKRGAEGVRVLLHTLNALQTERLVMIAENDPRQESFVFGQIAHRTGVHD